MSKPTPIEKYHKWMLDPELCCGTPETIALRMQKDFPELRHIKGKYQHPKLGVIDHHWLTWYGLIVDPFGEKFCYPGPEYTDGVEVTP